MTGDRLARTLQALLHRDTFELFVAPAIADLQRTPSVAAHAAVWTSAAGAFGQDLTSDAQLLLDEVGLMCGLILMQVCYYGGMMLLLVAHIRADQMLERLVNGGGPIVAMTAAGVFIASTVPTLLCFWPPRRTIAI